jgi:hypothetical protein
MISRPFSFGVGIDHFLSLATIFTHTFRLFHCHQIPHTRSPILSTLDLPLSKTSPIRSRNVRSSLSSITTHIRLLNLKVKVPHFHTLVVLSGIHKTSLTCVYFQLDSCKSHNLVQGVCVEYLLLVVPSYKRGFLRNRLHFRVWMYSWKDSWLMECYRCEIQSSL